MSSSALSVLDTLEDTLDYSEVVLNEGAIKGLFANQREDLKRNVALANQAWRTSGAAMRGCAACLNEIRLNTPKGNWKALLRSGDLDFSASIAEDLVAAHGWLNESSIPDRFLTNISARTIGTIARCKDPAKRALVESRIIEVEGRGLSESEMKKMLKPTVKVNRKKAGIKAKKGLDANASKAETIEYYTKIVDETQSSLDRSMDMIKKLTIANQDKAGEIGRLKEQIKDLKNAK